jgi:hypothetical protein
MPDAAPLDGMNYSSYTIINGMGKKENTSDKRA